MRTQFIVLCTILAALLVFMYVAEVDVPPTQEPIAAIQPVTPAEAVDLISQGENIIVAATNQFVSTPSIEFASTLFQITIKFEAMLIPLCDIEGTTASCMHASTTVNRSFTTLEAWLSANPQLQ